MADETSFTSEELAELEEAIVEEVLKEDIEIQKWLDENTEDFLTQEELEELGAGDFKQ